MAATSGKSRINYYFCKKNVGTCILRTCTCNYVHVHAMYISGSSNDMISQYKIVMSLMNCFMRFSVLYEWFHEFYFLGLAYFWKVVNGTWLVCHRRLPACIMPVACTPTRPSFSPYRCDVKSLRRLQSFAIDCRNCPNDAVKRGFEFRLLCDSINTTSATWLRHCCHVCCQYSIRKTKP